MKVFFFTWILTLHLSCSWRSLALSEEKVRSVSAQPLFLQRSWRPRPGARPDRHLCLILFGVSAGGGGDTFSPGTLGALRGERRSADEAGSELSSELSLYSLENLSLPPLGEDLSRDTFRFFIFFFFFSGTAGFFGMGLGITAG